MPAILLRSLCALALLVGMASAPTLAQDEDKESEDEETQKLPEIAPREIEIRGELQLSFPSLERQPLRGFASPPVVPSVPEDRTPYVESYKQTLDDLPESLPAPEAGSRPVASPNPPKHGLVEIGGGRYVSRFARARVSLPFSSRQRLSVKVDYTGTEGFSPFSGANVDTPTDEAEARVQFESRHDAFTLRADGHGSADQYTLYGIPAVAQDTAAEAPERTVLSGGAAFRLHTRGSVESSVELGYDYTQYETAFSFTDSPRQPVSTEKRLSFDGSATFSAGVTGVHLDLAASRPTVESNVASSSAYNVDGGAALQLLESDRLSVRAGGRFLGFETPAAGGTASSSASFVVPQGQAELSLSPAFTAYARNAPGISGGSVSDLYAENPYAAHAFSVRPIVMTTDAEAGFRLSLGPARLETSAGYRYAPSYRYFSSPTTDEEPFPVDYDSARILHGGLQFALQGVTGVEASAGVSVRDGTLVGDDAAIPYFSPLVADAMVSLSFADQRGLLQTTGTLESPRPIDRTESAEVRTYVSVDVEGSYEVTPLLDVVLRIQNLSPRAPKQWAQYPRPPASIMGGFRVHW